MRVLEDFPLATLRDYIDWTPFFHTWELQGRLPADPRAREVRRAGAEDLRRGATRCSTRSSRRSSSQARGVYGLFPANAVGDDVELYADETRSKALARFHFLRQQGAKDKGEPNRSLADFIAPQETGLPRPHRRLRRDDGHRPQGALRPLPGQARRLQRHHGRGARRPAGRGLRRVPAPARARGVGLRARARSSRTQELIDEKYRGIRPAAGYPACPDHTEKGTLWKLLDVEKNTGMLHHRVVRDVAGLERQRALLRAPGVALLHARQDRSRSGRSTTRARKGMTVAGSRALARAEPQLRSSELTSRHGSRRDGRAPTARSSRRSGSNARRAIHETTSRRSRP